MIAYYAIIRHCGFVATWLPKDYRNFNLEPGLRGKDEKIIVSSPELVDADME